METLHPDLVPFVRDAIVSHPLLRQPYNATEDATRINNAYREKRAELNAASRKGDWPSLVFLHERPHRIGALEDAATLGLSAHPTEYWQLVREVWIDSESIRQNLREWRRVWRADIVDRAACMTDEDRRVFDSLPDSFPVWRGTNFRGSVPGLSWTLDEARAEWFARRFPFAGPPLLARGVVRRQDVLAYFGSRDEREIVSTRVAGLQVIELDPTE